MRVQTSSFLTVWLWRAAFVGAAAAGAALPGCGSASDSASNAAAKSHTVAGTTQSPPLLAINRQAAEGNGAAESTASPEELLAEIKELRSTPFAEARTQEEISAAQRGRQFEIIQRATEVIAKTHSQPEMTRTFEDAVFLLMSARLQLALSGENDQVAALYGDAEALYKRDANSKAAAEAGYILVHYAHSAATRNPSPITVQEFARLARRFAENFPQEAPRAASVLLTAGKSCEMNGHTTASVACYRQLVEKFPTVAKAQEAAACLRRLGLVGQPLEIAGPTLPGGFATSASAREKGQPLLVFFWSPAQPDSGEWAKSIAKLLEERGEKVALLGVSVGEDPSTMSSFLENTHLGGEHLCFTGEGQQGWQNPVVTHYGLPAVPALWLIGRDGVVVSTNLTPATAPSALEAAFMSTASK